MANLELKNISKSYQVGTKRNLVLRDINLTVNDGELVSIVGPSGCGKTTLLKIIEGLIAADNGQVLIDGEVSDSPSEKKGIIFQDLALFPWLTALENIKFGLESLRFSSGEVKRMSQHYLKVVGLQQFGSYYPLQLSGGMRQRVALARVLAYNPEILLMDEPLASLDAITRGKLQEELITIWQKTNKTIVFVTHQIEEAIFLGQRVVIMSRSPGEIKKIIKTAIPKSADSMVKTSQRFNNLRRKIERLIL